MKHLHAAQLLILLITFSCISEQVEPQIDCSSSPVEISLLESSNTECNENNGSVSVSASGGEAPYTFTLGNSSSSDGSFQAIAAGSYSVIATDAKGCTDQINVTIENLSGVNLDNIISTTAGCGTSVGTIEVAASGGVEPYQFSIDGSVQSENEFTGLSSGSYSVTVTDDTGCSITEEVEVLSGVSYENSIKQVIANSCAVSGCHNGSVSPDLRSFSSIQSNASRIKARTGNRSMPRGSSLSDSQIDLIACWVDDGARAN